MATTGHQMTRVLKRTLTKAERDLLWAEAHFEYGVGAFVCDGPNIDRDEVQAQITLFQECTALYDDLGWQEHDNHESFSLTMSDELLQRIGARLRQTGASLLRDALKKPSAPAPREEVERDRLLLALGTEMEGSS